ncbi:hypothetical protein [Anaerocellum danielii]|uniref:Uncharacterized protein n=1 Tax=Anaerocellum danielii TaxID=1387557 RepID=A0ABZ0U3E9_9FIRM|nr:hypothetical protein [Caldicellulosiruptor danielii]WPX08225.1 hypothetical protein SOJ16_002092 [Caldicellulosiruptor danielii]
MIVVSPHAIKRFKERISPCSSDYEAELRILDAYIHGTFLAQKGKQKAVKKDNIVLIIHQEGGINIIRTVERSDFKGFWNKKKSLPKDS